MVKQQREVISDEVNLRLRVAAERAARGWSYEEVASRMTAAGCPTRKAAIFRIEHGNGEGKPPRQISVNELIAFGKIFEVEVTDLLTPIELLDRLRAKELVAEFDDATQIFEAAGYRLFGACIQYFDLAVRDVDLLQFVTHHLRAAESAQTPTEIEVNGSVFDDSALREALTTFMNTITSLSVSLVRSVHKIDGES